MGLTTKAVKSLLSRARMNLRSALSSYVYMDGEPVPVPETEDVILRRCDGRAGFMSKPSHLTEQEQADLVAYLDGELDAEASQRARSEALPRPGRRVPRSNICAAPGNCSTSCRRRSRRRVSRTAPSNVWFLFLRRRSGKQKAASCRAGCSASAGRRPSRGLARGRLSEPGVPARPCARETGTDGAGFGAPTCASSRTYGPMNGWATLSFCTTWIMPTSSGMNRTAHDSQCAASAAECSGYAVCLRLLLIVAFVAAVPLLGFSEQPAPEDAETNAPCWNAGAPIPSISPGYKRTCGRSCSCRSRSKSDCDDSTKNCTTPTR